MKGVARYALLAAVILAVFLLDDMSAADNDPDPAMVFAIAGSKEITYEGYRLYVDVNELRDRQTVRKDLAIEAMLENDLREMGVELEKDSFDQLMSQQVALLYVNPENAEKLEKIRLTAGIGMEGFIPAVIRSFWLGNLTSLAMDHYYELATADGAVGQEAVRQAHLMLQEHLDQMETRCLIPPNRPDLLCVIDGEELPLTTPDLWHIEYVVYANRYSLLSRLCRGELMMQALTALEYRPDQEEQETKMAAWIKELEADKAFTTELDSFLTALGAGRQDYYASMRKALTEQLILDDYAELVMRPQYRELEPGGDEAGERAYSNTHFEQLLGQSQLINISGKPNGQ